MRKNIHSLRDQDKWYEDAAWVLKPSGSVVVDGKEVAYTLQCQHCGAHFVYRKSRGRFMCTKCSGDVCGAAKCVNECRPLERALDLYEKGIIPSL